MRLYLPVIAFSVSESDNRSSKLYLALAPDGPQRHVGTRIRPLHRLSVFAAHHKASGWTDSELQLPAALRDGRKFCRFNFVI